MERSHLPTCILSWPGRRKAVMESPTCTPRQKRSHWNSLWSTLCIKSIFFCVYGWICVFLFPSSWAKTRKIIVVDSVFIVMNEHDGISELACTVVERVREREVDLCTQVVPAGSWWSSTRGLPWPLWPGLSLGNSKRYFCQFAQGRWGLEKLMVSQENSHCLESQGTHLARRLFLWKTGYQAPALT